METMGCGSESSKRKLMEDVEFQNLPPPTPLREMKSAYKRNQITLDSSSGTASSNKDIRRHLVNISQGIKTGPVHFTEMKNNYIKMDLAGLSLGLGFNEEINFHEMYPTH